MTYAYVKPENLIKLTFNPTGVYNYKTHVNVILKEATYDELLQLKNKVRDEMNKPTAGIDIEFWQFVLSVIRVKIDIQRKAYDL